MGEVVLEMRNIVKDFPGVRALDDVTFQARSGEVLALVGENGAGKSTLMKVLSGVWPYPTYEGDIVIKGERCRFRNTREAEDAKVAIIYQELNLIPELSVAENIFLDRLFPNPAGIVNWSRVYSEAHQLLKQLGLKNINPADKISALTVGMQQMVEIAKALSKDAEILVFDEPTSALTDSEVETLFRTIRTLKEKGVCMTYISHKMDELQQIADRVAVLRDGKTIGPVTPVADITMDEIISRMVGRNIEDMFPKVPRNRGEEVLKVTDLSLKHPVIADKMLIKDVSFSAYKGEILGISGLMGSGRSELVSSIFGAYKHGSFGTVTLNGKQLKIKRPVDAIKEGIALVTEDRKALGLILGQSVLSNMTIGSLETVAQQWGVINKAKERNLAREFIAKLNIKTPSLDVAIDTLSGGNQQKVIVAKWLNTAPKVLILDEPTRGIDIGAKVEIYNLLNKLVQEGVTIIMISSELPEIMGMCHRILVMCEGEIAADLDEDVATKELIMEYGTGKKKRGE